MIWQLKKCKKNIDIFYFTGYRFFKKFVGRVFVGVVFAKVFFVGTIFVGTDFARTIFVTSIISARVFTESTIILPPQYLPFSQVDVPGFQIFFFRTHVFLNICPHIGICLSSNFDLNYIFYRQSCIYIRMIYVLIMFLVYLFLLSNYKHLNMHVLYCLEHIFY